MSVKISRCSKYCRQLSSSNILYRQIYQWTLLFYTIIKSILLLLLEQIAHSSLYFSEINNRVQMVAHAFLYTSELVETDKAVPGKILNLKSAKLAQGMSWFSLRSTLNFVLRQVPSDLWKFCSASQTHWVEKKLLISRTFFNKCFLGFAIFAILINTMTNLTPLICRNNLQKNNSFKLCGRFRLDCMIDLVSLLFQTNKQLD